MAVQRTCDGCGETIRADSEPARLHCSIPFKWHDCVLELAVVIADWAKVRQGAAGTADICMTCAGKLRVAIYARFADLNPNVSLVKE